jgi:hypothetical protein
MHSVINFVELENRVISATYRHLMIRAKVLLVGTTSGAELNASPPITSRLPSGALRIRLSGFDPERGLSSEGVECAWRISRPQRRLRD